MKNVIQKTITVLLSLTLATSLLAGCGKTSAPAAAEAKPVATAAPAATEAAAAPAETEAPVAAAIDKAAFDELIASGIVADDADIEANAWAAAVKKAGVLRVGGTRTSFCSEYLMAGMNTISPGQIEAARSLGMTFFQTVKNVVLPQALRSSVLPLTNLLVATMLTTALASQVPLNTLLAFRHGELVDTGRNHGNEYVTVENASG